MNLRQKLAIHIKAQTKAIALTSLTSLMLFTTAPTYATEHETYTTQEAVEWHLNKEQDGFYDKATFEDCLKVVDYYFKQHNPWSEQTFNYADIHKKCATSELERQDKTLNKRYQNIIKHASNDLSTTLRDSQRKWLKHRDAHCDLVQYLAHSHNSKSPNRLACIVETTRLRNKELEALFKLAFNN